MAQIHLIKSALNTLTPATPEASEYLRRLKPGILLNCDVRQARNYRFHKLFFSLLNLGFHYWTPTAGAITEPEKQLLRGYVDYLISIAGHQNILVETLEVWLGNIGHCRADGVVLVKSFEAYRKWAVMTAGFWDEFILPDGTVRREARSISFASMSEDEFREVYKAVLNVLWLHILNRPFSSPQEARRRPALGVCRMKNQTCLFCGAPAILLCDGHLGYQPNEHQPECISPFEPYTCDAPMCRHCATLKSTMHICRRRGGCIIDTVDHCPACVANLPEDHRRIIHSPEQAATIRAAHWISSPTDFQNWDQLIAGGGQQCLDL